jgi:formylmethanofuran dehydrogenase subunit E
MRKNTIFDIEEYILRVRSFHGHVAPGVIIGGFMVHSAQGRLPEGVLFDAICETPKCLPDAVQLLTPCTVGNGWLRIVNLGRFALSLYDKHKGSGFRAFLDPKKMERWPEIKAWFFRLRPKAEQDHDRLISQIKESGEKLCSIQTIQVQPGLLGRHGNKKVVVCPLCEEAHPARDSDICPACRGLSPYVVPKF